jgi:hypothetical protein
VPVPPLRTERAVAVAAAAAHDLNDDLTIILTGVTAFVRVAGRDHPALPLLLEMQSAAQRCAWTASALLNFSARRGARPSAATASRLIDDDRRALP